MQPRIARPEPMVAPSVLSADFANLQRDIEMLNASSADWVHCDIMDGRFVPNISFGMPVLAAIKRHSVKPLDVHLMIVEPDDYLEAFRDAGADWLTVHVEACTHLHRTLQAIRNFGMNAGVALNPHTPVLAIQEVLHMCDLVLLMSVNPGFGGQRYIHQTYSKLRQLKRLIAEAALPTLIEVDGGVTDANAAQLAEAGADVLVAGNFVFNAPDPPAAIRSLKQPPPHPQFQV